VTAVGFTLQPDPEFLELLGDLLRTEPDYFELAPETTWREHPDGTLLPNSYAQLFLDLGDSAHTPFVAHGVGFSVGSGDDDLPRQQRWLRRLALDHQLFRFRWLTDHLGFSFTEGANLTLPLALPCTPFHAARVRRALARLQEVVPEVGVENAVPYFFPGNPLDEATFLRRALAAPGMHLLLDLHNLWTVAEHASLDPDAYLAHLDLTKVIEIHVSGGSYSAPTWHPEGRTRRLDSHDSAVPEPVFRLLERVVPRCPHLRGVTLERMEGTVQPHDVPVLREELRTIRRLVASAGKRPRNPSPSPYPEPVDEAVAVDGSSPPSARAEGDEVTSADTRAYEQALRRALTASDPVTALATEREQAPSGSEVRGWLDAIDEDGFRLAALLVARLRFERLTRGSPEADAWFEEAPAAFAEAFRAYHAAVAPGAYFPGHEARLFASWQRSYRPGAGG
jgi:hypothetical protein